MAFLKTLFDANERDVAKLRRTAALTNSFEPAISALTDDQLRAKTEEFRKRLDEDESLDSIIPEAFAVVREAGKRTLGMRHFDVQIMGGQVLLEGRIAEMKTGEGKTLVATLPVYVRALEKRGVHVVTVNDYLARRDSEWMGPLYESLGLTVGVIQHGLDAGRSAVRRTPATSRTSPTTKSASTTCATTWRGKSRTSCSASSTSRWWTKSTRSSWTRRARR